MSDPDCDIYGALDDAQVGILNAVVERLIPSDEHGPGAREARAARYIVAALSSEYRRYLNDYVAGLAAVDTRARAAYAAPFVALDPGRQDEVLAHIEAETSSEGPTPRSFFDLLLRHTREGVFGDPRWGGNADRVGWELIGYAGPKPSWTAEEQCIEFIHLGTEL